MRRGLVLLALLSATAWAQDPRDMAKQALGLIRQGSIDEGIGLANQALRIDENCGPAYGARGYGQFKRSDRSRALQDYSRAVELDPADPMWRLLRCQCYMSIDEWQKAREDAEAGFEATNQNPQFRSLRGWARINLGEVDEGLADMDAAFATNPSNPGYIYRFDGYFFKADWKSACEESQRQIATGTSPPPPYFFQVRALTEMGQYKEAWDAVEALTRKFGDVIEARLSRAYVLGTPDAKELYDVTAALEAVRSCQSPQSLAHTSNTTGRIYFLAGRYRDAVYELETHGRRTNFDTLFLLGASEFRLGNLADARRDLRDARRLNPYIAKHAERIEGLAEFLKTIDTEIAQEGKVDRKELGEEQATALLTVAELETMLRRFKFDRAVKGYEKYLAELVSPVRKKEVEQRLAEVRGLSSGLKKLMEKVNSGKLKDLKFQAAGIAVQLAKSVDDEWFEYTFAQGSGKGVWASLGVSLLLDFLDKAGPSAEERFAMGAFAWDMGQVEKGVDHLTRAVKADGKLKGRFDSFVAARRGLEVPKGGFLVFKGRFVTPEEKKNLEKGLVLYEGQWVTTADRDKLAAGLMKVGEKWVPREEGELLAMGYRKYKGKWMSPEDYAAARGKWDAAYEEKTEHYDIKTNKSEEFARELGRLIEATYQECKKFYGGKEPKLPGKERMTLYAFGAYDDYRTYCVENHAEAQLQAAGFAVSNSNVVVGWDKAGHEQSFLATMAHEAAHLYFFRVAPNSQCPSWYAEGMATQFEGFRWDGKAYVYDRRSQERVPFVRQAASNGRQMPIDQLIAGDALTLINSDHEKALLFYAECWGLVYFLSETDNPKYKAAWEKFREEMDSGKQANFAEHFTDLKGLEAEFVKFVKRL